MGSTGFAKYIPTLSNKSQSDSREYRGLELQNGVKIILISDADTDKSGASFSIAAGNWSDPPNLPGLAHFTEHMLFLGTEKYPEESGFGQFLSVHSGDSNAFTYNDHTAFIFTVSPDKFPEALDRFAQFLICPLFNPDATEREVRAVDSENSKNVPNDDRRSLRVNQTTAKPGHPFSHFTTGNYESLMTRPKAAKINIVDELIKFHGTYYSSNLTTLCVLGKESLDELESIVTPLFSQVKNLQAQRPICTESPYGENELQKRIDIVPVKDIREVGLVFPMDYLKEHYLSGAEKYVGHLIGHEGPGSIYSKLRRQGFATSLTAWGDYPGPNVGQFRIRINLSVEGWNNLNNVIQSVFQYIKMLQSTEPAQEIWNEIRDVKEIEYRFKEKGDPFTVTEDYASKLHDYPMEDILIAQRLTTEYRPDLIKQILSGLVPEKCRILTNCKANAWKINPLLTEEWYGVKYSIDQIPSTLIQEWTNCALSSEFHLPEQNEFIPSNFELKAREDNGILPQLLIQNEYSILWFLQDNEFKLPKGNIRVEFLSHQPGQDITNCIYNTLFGDLVEDDLNESLYAGTITGFDYSVETSTAGFQIEAKGYSDKLFGILTKIIQTILNFRLDESRYNVIFEKYERKLNNWENNEPRAHASYFKDYLLLESGWTVQEKLNALSQINYAELEKYYKEKLLQKLKTNWFIYGNFTQQEAISFVTSIEEMLKNHGTAPLHPSQYQLKRVIGLPLGSDFVFNTVHRVHASSCVLTYFALGILNQTQKVTLKLLRQIIAEPIYSKLRTDEQLGYIVYSWKDSKRESDGLGVVVQSYYQPEYLESRIDKFMESMKDSIEAMSDDEFELEKKSLAVKLSMKPKTIAARVNRVWNEITNRTYYFERLENEVKELATITKDQVLALLEELIGSKETRKGRLGVHVTSLLRVEDKKSKAKRIGPFPIDNPRNWVQIEDVTEWKSHQALLPLPEPRVQAKINSL